MFQLSSYAVYAAYIVLGLLPSIIWLIFYLRQDRHPEPKIILLSVFLGGALMGPVAIGLQYLAVWLTQPTSSPKEILTIFSQNHYLFLLNILVFAPITEELLKYLVVRWRVLRDPAFDEPVDAMIYMIVSALGFAATENLLIIFLRSDLSLSTALSQSIARFLSATLLHTLASGILGYFLARSMLNFKRRYLIFGFGFLLAVAFHSFYNYLAWLLDFNKIFIVVLALFLVTIAALNNWEFNILKKQKSVCRLD